MRVNLPTKQNKKMTTESDITSAIVRSVSHNEIVQVEVKEIESAYLEVSLQTEDCDRATEKDGSEDVWGTTDDGAEFRIRLVLEK